jgi:hypothetical protein
MVKYRCAMVEVTGMHSDDEWLDLEAAAHQVGRTLTEVRAAVDDRSLAAVTTHPARPGTWMVCVADVERWARHRSDG